MTVAVAPVPVVPPTPVAPATRRRTKGAAVISWIETHCVFTKGDWIGRPFRLLPWQKRLILELFTVRDDGLRQYRWGYVSVPKKNGKTELAAAIALYLLIGDGEPAPWIVCAAASDDQADLVFGAAKTMCEMSPTLRLVTERYESEILVPSIPGAKLQRVAAASGTNDGPNLSAVICDELHEWSGSKGENVWTVLTNGVINRRQPLVLQITTAGYDKDTVCGRQYDLAKRILADPSIDPTYYVYVVEPAADADFRDEDVWASVNPSWNVTVGPEALRDQLRKKPENVFRRYFMNEWTEAEESWLPPAAWSQCLDRSYALDLSLPLFVAIDAARTHDSTAVVLSQPQGERIVQRARVWENPYPLEDARHGEWRMDLATIENYLLELFEQYATPAQRAPDSDRLAPGPAFYFDPWRFDRSAEILAGKGLNMIAFPQVDGRMAPACMGYYELIAAGRIAHDGDETFARQIAAAVRKDVSDRAWRLTRRGKHKHIDAAIAGAISGSQAAALPASGAKPRSRTLVTF